MLTFETIKRYFDMGLWSKYMVSLAAARGKITAEQYQEITGETYTA